MQYVRWLGVKTLQIHCKKIVIQHHMLCVSFGCQGGLSEKADGFIVGLFFVERMTSRVSFTIPQFSLRLFLSASG